MKNLVGGDNIEEIKLDDTDNGDVDGGRLGLIFFFFK